MVELTERQRQELTTTDAPTFLDPATGNTYVLVRTDVYERLKEILQDTPRVTGEMVDRLMEDEDRDDPTLPFYQQKYGASHDPALRCHHRSSKALLSRLPDAQLVRRNQPVVVRRCLRRTPVTPTSAAAGSRTQRPPAAPHEVAARRRDQAQG